MIMFLILNYNPDEHKNGYITFAFSDKDKAIMLTRNLNKQYGYGCKFDKDGEFVDTVNYLQHNFFITQMVIEKNEDVTPLPTNYFKGEGIKLVIEIYNKAETEPCGYVGKDDIQVSAVEEARKFDTWEDVMNMIELLEKLDVYTNQQLVVQKEYK